ncbi:MAG: dTDP-4-dehydrorhamnose 3,5-epimerase [Chitinophagales bacterium]|nr:dTDP-4-dehydrorhamnose 3,5-epimerase [Chitinophagales bacterium]MDW8419124.1 dTDP-4-dehydrorhamnose 3,5-epimerase [Chitinophagales bacterium]
MPFIETGFPGLLLFEPKVFTDSRGYFFESFNHAVFKEAGIDVRFVQDNESKSVRGVVRGLHYQLHPMAQAKLVRVVQGEVLDVVLDLRRGSPTYGRHYSVVLNEENKIQLFIPRGFAHGFSVLSEVCIFQYKCDNLYSKEHERGIHILDPTLNIDWGVKPEAMIISDKDKVQPLFNDSEHNFVWQT